MPDATGQTIVAIAMVTTQDATIGQRIKEEGDAGEITRGSVTSSGPGPSPS